MKKLIILLICCIAQLAHAQTLIGIAENDETSSIIEYNIPQKKMEIVKTFNGPVEGIPDSYTSPLCKVGDKLYGRTTLQGMHGAGTIYAYNRVKKEITVLYSFPKGTKSNPTLHCSAKGLLYGMAVDSIKGSYLYEFDPVTKKFDPYYMDKELKFLYDYYTTVAQNGKVYVFGEREKTGNELSNYSLMEFDPQTKVFTEKANTQTLRYFYAMTFCDMTDVGNGLLVATLQRPGGGAAIIVCDYINNTIKEIEFEKKYISARTTGAAVVYEGSCYVIADGTSKKVAGIYKVNLTTGVAELVADMGKLEIWIPIPCLVVNDKLYGYEADRPVLFEYDFKTKKFTVLGSYGKELNLRRLGKLTVVN